MKRLVNLAGTAGAWLSDDDRLRWVLWRRWSTEPALGYAMLNPSTANHEIDDPTIRRCVAFALREGAGGVVVVNLSPLRATDPAELYSTIERAPAVAFPDGATAVRLEALARCDRVVAAWGAMAGAALGVRAELLRSAEALVRDVQRLGLPLLCLGTTAAGDPRHPLYLRADAPLTPWEFRG